MKSKIVAVVAILLLAAPGLSARHGRMKPLTPYQYGGRWYVSVQGGPMYTSAEYTDTFFEYGLGWNAFSFQGALSVGYNLSDAWDIRVSGTYSINSGALAPYKGFYPYTYQAAHLFADMVLNYYALGEYNICFSPKTYFGLGAGYTHAFSDVDHPYQAVEGPNLVPGFRFGGILEYDTKGGLGFFVDLGFEGFTDWYNGLEPVGFPIDMEIKLSLGMIYHFPLIGKK